jgi:hypothetical protein
MAIWNQQFPIPIDVFIYGSLNDIVSSSNNTLSRNTNNCIIKDVEGKDCGIMCSNILAFAWRSKEKQDRQCPD